MKQWLMSAAIVLLTVSWAVADGDGPTRNMTAAETAAYESTKKMVRDALPSPPVDYTSTLSGFESSAQLPEGMSSDRMHRMSFSVRYILTGEAGQKQAVAALMKRTQGSQAQQDKLAALRARNAELKKARKTRDRDEKERIRAELKAVQGEENRLVAEIASANQAQATAGGGIPAMQEAVRALPAKELSIRFQINQDVRIHDQAKPHSIPGFPMAFGQNEGCADFGSYCITVLLGPFEKGKRVNGIQPSQHPPGRPDEAARPGARRERTQGQAGGGGRPKSLTEDGPREAEGYAALSNTGYCHAPCDYDIIDLPMGDGLAMHRLA